LAEDGFTGAPAITCEADEVRDIWADLGHNWRILESNFKAYPVCRWAHPAIVAALELMQEKKVSVPDIQEVIVTTFHEATQLNTRRPADGDEAQYSLPLTLALAITHGELLPEHILPAAYDEMRVWQLVDKVSFAQSDTYNAAFPGERYADVAFIMEDGQRFASKTAVAPGNYNAPLTDKEITQKLDHYSAAVLSVQDRQKLLNILTDPALAPTPAELIKIIVTRTVSLDIK
jgi:2-methylcitrate dehydratase PrpD